ncbi:PAS domain-containing protein [Nannocystis radixulma]|uniref:histidine kinase n=1 Tax=Nannocystis radixulma TaxID=2995305 RepID=A0ABT5B6I6_9BACT|nr:PAS domain-containing protein [Nannocystis radixulma]MDC0669083.1 PAS domain-containing protein [Nannocystis radixulma]
MARLIDHARCSKPRRYLVAAGVTALAAGLRLFLAVTLEPRPPILLLFTGAAGVSAWFGGLGPALLTIALSSVLDVCFFDLADPVHQWTDLVDLGIFALVALAVAWLCESLHTARRLAEARARELALVSAGERAWKDRYEAAVRASGHILYDFDRNSGRAMFSGACLPILGYSAQELGEHIDWSALVHPDDLPRYLASREGGSLAVEYRVRHRDGRYVTLHDVGEQVHDAGGQVVRVVGFLKDVTAQRQAQALVRASEERLRLAVEATGLGVTATVFERDGSVRFEWTREARRLFDVADDVELTLADLLARVHSDDLPAARAAVQAALDPDGDGSDNLEFRIVRRDGSVRWLGCQGRTVFDNSVRPPRPLRNIGILRDVTERKATAAQLAESFALIDALVMKAPIGMAFIDREYRYVRVNDKLAEFNGLPPAGHIGLTVAEVVPTLWPILEPFLRDGLRDGLERVNIEMEGDPRGSGSLRHWLLSQYPIRVGDRLLGVGITVIETTAQKRIEASLREGDQRKDTFIATLAHELRNPLAPIRNALALLAVARDSPERSAGVAVIGRQVEQMAHLLEDLLDVSRITRGRLTLRREPITLASVMARAAETAEPWIHSRRHRFDVDLPATPVILDADPMRLAQVFSNLFTNAAKYTEPGGAIRVSAVVVDERVRICVADTGVGIAAEHLPRLFEMFSQVGPTQSRSEGGLGIGLALARGLVEMHGGQISARSEGLGRGSEFIVDLPLAVADTTARPRARPGPVLAARPSGWRIVVADDNVDNADTLAMLLEAFGNEVHTVYDGEAAIRACAEFRPDVVFLDIGMPKLDGYDVCRWIRQQPWGARTMLIAQTGWGQDEDRRRAEAAGFDHHLTKPADPDRLIALLSRSAGPRSAA